MFTQNTMMYLRDVHMTQITMPTQGKGKSRKANACAISLVIEPFLNEQAGTIGPELVETLFADDSLLAKPGVKKLSWVMSPAPKDSFRVTFRGAPDTLRAACTLSDVRIASTLEIKRDKDASVFKATLVMTFEADKNQLAYLAAAYTGQMFVTIDEQQPTLQEQD